MGHQLDGLARGYNVLGVGQATSRDEVFRDLVLARIIEPVSKLDSLRVLEEAGVALASYATLKQRRPAYAKRVAAAQFAAACAPHAGLCPASLVLYDVSTLYFEAGEGDGFREPGLSKERRLEPQITIRLLTDESGFPLAISAFEGNMAETKTMLPVIESFIAAHHLPDVTVVADAGMICEANQKAIEGRRPVVPPRYEDPARALRGRPVAARAPGRADPRRARVHPALAGRAERRPANAARDR
jgi:hypothetical protein